MNFYFWTSREFIQEDEDLYPSQLVSDSYISIFSILLLMYASKILGTTEFNIQKWLIDSWLRNYMASAFGHKMVIIYCRQFIFWSVNQYRETFNFKLDDRFVHDDFHLAINHKLVRVRILAGTAPQYWNNMCHWKHLFWKTFFEDFFGQ